MKDKTIDRKRLYLVGRVTEKWDNGLYTAGRIIAVAKCWMYPVEYARRRELKNHFGAAPHSRLRDILVSGTDEEKAFRRLVNLKQHVMQLHTKVADDAPSNFFGERDGFSMALHPKDYSQIVHGTPLDSRVAVQATVRILIWVGKCPKTSRSNIA
ncbi:hypothetical protein CHS0354_032692 [Potamilus streckersoni]|uniref:Uncharacterized protein n=1 Tax=Potamilus streckersoni TaxID=2493646 RepID=A0AAE0SR32_9BIVA|nr:hypothetical protein CHS0354_032692 [Potamilus streckersoni]